MLDSAIIITAMCLPVIIFYRSKPAELPSAAAKYQMTAKFEFVKDMKELFKNTNFILLSITYSIVYGIFCCLGAILSNFMKPYGYTPK